MDQVADVPGTGLQRHSNMRPVHIILADAAFESGAGHDTIGIRESQVKNVGSCRQREGEKPVACRRVKKVHLPFGQNTERYLGTGNVLVECGLATQRQIQHPFLRRCEQLDLMARNGPDPLDKEQARAASNAQEGEFEDLRNFLVRLLGPFGRHFPYGKADYSICYSGCQVH